MRVEAGLRLRIVEESLDRIARALLAHLPDVGHGGDLLDGDLTADQLLDRGEHPSLAGLDQAQGHALASGTTHATDAVHVGLRAHRQVVVDDVRKEVDVQATSRDIGGDEQLAFPDRSRPSTRVRWSCVSPPCSASAW